MKEVVRLACKAIQWRGGEGTNAHEGGGVGRAGEATRRKEVVRFARDTVRVNKKMLPVRITKE
jgi:hypothetical protein